MIRLTTAAALCAAALALALAPSTANAQACAGSQIEIKVELPQADGTFKVESPDRETEFFNLANCLCDTAFNAELLLPSGDATFNNDADVWVGTGCNEAMTLEDRETKCLKVGSYNDIVDDFAGGADLQISTGALIATNLSCAGVTGARTLEVLVEDDDADDTSFLCEAKKEIQVDADPPPVPARDTISVDGGEEALIVSWDQPDSGADDVEFYQVLCARAATEETGDDGFGGDAEYTTSQAACNEDYDQINNTLRAEHPELPEALLDLQSSTICGTASGTSTQIRVEGLTNGVRYEVVLVAIDEARNGSVIYAGSGEPQPVRDFWEDYKDQGGGAEGGVCLITATYGDNGPIPPAMREFRDGALASAPFGAELTAGYYWISDRIAPTVAADPWLRALFMALLLPLIAVAWLWQAIGLAGIGGLLVLAWMWRRSRRDRAPRGRMAIAATAAAMVLAGSMSSAFAQSTYDPYWEAWDDSESHAGPAVPHWNLQLQVGPYLPAIDDSFDVGAGEEGPFEEMFRGKGLLMWGVELQRFFWFPEGQLGATASLSFMGRSTNAYQVDSAENVVRDADGNPVRAPGNKTRFRMAPMSLGAVYRLTALDDRWGIPIVPYGKLGLSYYLWWIRNPSGDFARAKKDPTCIDSPGMGCATTRALGASIGYQASLGLSLRAERIDKNAASNLRNEMGIEHAGFFAELFYAKVDHFGASDRLPVGDFTWLAGLTFEF